jgi:spermidine synthase
MHSADTESPALPGSQRSRLQRRTAVVLMVASGCAGLGYQIVWTQQGALWLGHETAAVLAVVAAFFFGLGVGAWSVAPAIERSRRPAAWYAACEVLIGVWGLSLALFAQPIGAWLLEVIGARPTPAWHWFVSFSGTSLLLLPATAAMGATLPAMERVLARLHRQGSTIAALYGWNTFGAVAGVLFAAFWWIPAYGLLRTAAACAALNFLCAVLAWLMLRDVDEPRVTAIRGPREFRFASVLLFTGMLGIGYEVLVVRVLSQVAENTVYTFAMLLAVYLVGTSLGAATYHRGIGPRTPTGTLDNPLILLVAATCLAGTATLWFAHDLKAMILAIAGPGLTAALTGEALLALIAFALPTVAMGALFSHLCTRARLADVPFGRALACNTLGAASAPVIFGVVLLPVVGAKSALLLVSAGYLLLTGPSARWSWSWPTAAIAAAALGLLVFAPPLAHVEIPSDGRLVSYHEGAMAAVSIVEDRDGVARLHINNRQQEGSSATLYSDARQALLPLLLHSQPTRALFLGVGTGMTVSSAAEITDLQVDAVELLPEVVTASEYFRALHPAGLHNPRLAIITADARRFVRASDDRYDVIVSDNFHPARSGSGSLYTVEHFAAVRERLAQDGLFCQWLPLHQLDLATLRSIVKSFVTVYPDTWAVLATYSLDTPTIGLVAAPDNAHFDLQRLRARLFEIKAPYTPAEFGFDDELALLGTFVAGPASMRGFAGDAVPNTDDHPIVSYRAPRITYAADSHPSDRLLELLEAVSLDPEEVVGGAIGDAWSQDMAAYWHARDRFLAVGRNVRPSPDVIEMLAQVQEPLLEVLRISPEFRPAREPLLRMAEALGASDAAAARALRREIDHTAPEVGRDEPVDSSLRTAR